MARLSNRLCAGVCRRRRVYVTMRAVTGLLSALCLATACAGPESRLNPARGFVECVEPRPQMCTMEYVPVCAALQNESRKTYPNGCAACADAEVDGYVEAPCPAEAP